MSGSGILVWGLGLCVFFCVFVCGEMNRLFIIVNLVERNRILQGIYFAGELLRIWIG